MIGIYKVVSPTNRVYIGQSRNIKKRISNYKCLDCKKQKRLYASFLKYGVHNHKFEILEECTIDNLNTKERYYQDLYEVLSIKGLNCTLTEHGLKAMVYSDETRLKMSKSRIGIKLSEKTKEKLRAIGKLQGGNFKKGHVMSQETRNKISISGKGRKPSDNQKQAVKLAIGRKVIDTESGIIYDSIKDCSVVIGINQTTLGRYLNGKRKNKTKFEFYDKILF